MTAGIGRACYNGWVGVCQTLVAAGVEISPENVFSETPLHAACTAGSTQTLIDFLLSQPGVNVNRQGKDGHTGALRRGRGGLFCF